VSTKPGAAHSDPLESSLMRHLYRPTTANAIVRQHGPRFCETSCSSVRCPYNVFLIPDKAYIDSYRIDWLHFACIPHLHSNCRDDLFCKY
jgi:hypothetical protein